MAVAKTIKDTIKGFTRDFDPAETGLSLEDYEDKVTARERFYLVACRETLMQIDTGKKRSIDSADVPIFAETAGALERLKATVQSPEKIDKLISDLQSVCYHVGESVSPNVRRAGR